MRVAGLRARWNRMVDHPILRLERRRIRRRWWPGRRFFLFYPVLLGMVLGFALVLILTDWPGAFEAGLVAGIPTACVLGAVVWLLSFALPWIAPALTAVSVAREREMASLDLLRVTLLSERSIVLGKLAACLAWLWPGILLLVLLAPFQAVRLVGGNLFIFPSANATMLLAASGLSSTELIFRPVWVWLVLATLAGAFLRPFSDLGLHAAIGLFASVVSRTSGTALGVSYGAILATRAVLWVLSSLLLPALILPLIDPGGWTGADMGSMALLWGLIPIVIVVIEILAAAALVWGAVRRLERA